MHLQPWLSEQATKSWSYKLLISLFVQNINSPKEAAKQSNLHEADTLFLAHSEYVFIFVFIKSAALGHSYFKNNNDSELKVTKLKRYCQGVALLARFYLTNSKHNPSKPFIGCTDPVQDHSRTSIIMSEIG